MKVVEFLTSRRFIAILVALIAVVLYEFDIVLDEVETVETVMRIVEIVVLPALGWLAKEKVDAARNQ